MVLIATAGFLLAITNGTLIDEIIATDRRADAVILTLGHPRVALAIGSRWRDYFPHSGAVDTFAVYSNLVSRLFPQTSQTSQTFQTSFNWWYLRGPYGVKVENRAAILSTLGRSYIGEQAEGILCKYGAEFAANGGKPLVLRAKGWDCIAAAHAYAAGPQIFGGIEFTDRPPSWTEMVTKPDTKDDSFAVGVWGALVDYDWIDLIE